MKSIARYVASGILMLALVLPEAVPGRASSGGAPEAGRNEGCAGETFRVSIVRHVHFVDRENAPGNLSATGFLHMMDWDYAVHGTYVSELRNGKLRWVSRSVDWAGQFSNNTPACRYISCESGGQLDLGPTDGGADGVSGEQQGQMKWNCKEEKTGNCFGYSAITPIGVPFPKIRGTRDILRSGCCYSAVDGDGTRYSETVEQRGNEEISVSAEPSEIVPNQSVKNPDENTSQLTVKVTCDGAPLKDRFVGLRIDVKPRSGYHNHVDGRPRGKLASGTIENGCGVETGAPEGSDDSSCITVKTDANGEAKVKFKSPLTGSTDYAKYGAYKSGIAGDYKITAKDTQFTEVRSSTTILAKVDGLQPATFDNNLVQGRGDTSDSSAHPDGSYGTPGTVSAFSNLANDFRRYQDLHNAALVGCKKDKWPIAQLSMNDIALPTGGIFDWKISKTPWRPSHQTHNKGEGGDFNRFGASAGINWNNTGTECDGSTAVLQVWYMQVLLELAKKYGSWDCSDLGASGGSPIFSPSACAAGEFPVGQLISPPPGYQGPPWIYYPPDLHLHVFVSLGGDG